MTFMRRTIDFIELDYTTFKKYKDHSTNKFMNRLAEIMSGENQNCHYFD